MGAKVVILPTFAHVETWRKRMAEARDGGAFGQTVATFESWIADLWELHGDGRLLVDGVQRHMFMQMAAREVNDSMPQGTVRIAADCARIAAGVARFDRAVRDADEGRAIDGLSSFEIEFLRMVAHYYRLVEARGLVELGHAAAILAEEADLVFPRPLDVLVAHAAPLSWIQNQFFDACERLNVRVELAPGADGVPKAASDVKVRFGYPSGALAEPGLIADIVEGFGDDGSVVVSCKDPIDMFGRIERRLSGGRCVCLQARKPFGQTDFGRAFLACYRGVAEAPFDPAALSDVLGSPFAGFSRAEAVQADTRMRLNRALMRDDALADLRLSSELFSQLEELVGDPEADVLLGVFEQSIQGALHRSSAWRAEQLAAVRAVRDTMSAARMSGADMAACADSLRHAQVSVAVAGASARPQVLVTSLQATAQLASGSYAHVVAADLTAGDYPVAERDDAQATLFTRLGMCSPDSALSKARRDFTALVHLPEKTLDLLRPLGDANAEETYPCVVLEEFVDAYRDDPSDADDLDNDFRIPAALQRGLMTRGEELLYANALAEECGAAQAFRSTVAERPIDWLSPEHADSVMIPRRDAQGNELPKACPSPSQVETYLECPYRWFVTRRMRTEGVDEGFGPLEQGSFAHAVLEEFYRRFQAAGHSKVNAQNLDEARSLMQAVANSAAARQVDEPPGSRYVAITEMERREVNQLCRQLVGYLDFEAELLPTFSPMYFEYKISADSPVEYAGHLLVGMVDRIDVDENGRAVIIDYKGSVNEEHEMSGKTADHAGKVQTRMYARAVERALGLTVVGALYVTYGRNPVVSGAYDSRYVEAAHLPGMRHDRCASGSLEAMPDSPPEDFSLKDLTFDAMLDETEHIVADAIDRMKQGCVDARPSHKQTCRYCPVVHCPKRGE